MYDIDHSVPPVPVPAGSYALWTIPGGYRFLYPIVALAAVKRDEHSSPMWRAVYLSEDSELEAVNGSHETLNLSEDEAAELRHEVQARNADLDNASTAISRLLEREGTGGADPKDVREWFEWFEIREARYRHELIQGMDAVTVDGRVYLDKFAPNTDEEENR